jgi:hypothetical protein
MVRIVADPTDLIFEERCVVREPCKVPGGSLSLLEHAKIGIDQEITSAPERSGVALDAPSLICFLTRSKVAATLVCEAGV